MATATRQPKASKGKSPASETEVQETPVQEVAVVEAPKELPPILDLNTLDPKRAPILIDGEMYELKLMGDYGIEEQHLISQESNEFNELWASKQGDLKREQRKRLKLLLDRLAVKAIDLPKDVRERLNDDQLKSIVQVFTSPLLQNLQTAVAQLVVAMAEAEMARTGSTSET